MLANASIQLKQLLTRFNYFRLQLAANLFNNLHVWDRGDNTWRRDIKLKTLQQVTLLPVIPPKHQKEQVAVSQYSHLSTEPTANPSSPGSGLPPVPSAVPRMRPNTRISFFRSYSPSVSAMCLMMRSIASLKKWVRAKRHFNWSRRIRNSFVFTLLGFRILV